MRTAAAALSVCALPCAQSEAPAAQPVDAEHPGEDDAEAPGDDEGELHEESVVDGHGELQKGTSRDLLRARELRLESDEEDDISVTVTVKRAKGLKAVDRGGTSDPYEGGPSNPSTSLR